MITFTKQQPHNDGYICSSSDEGGDDEKARAEQQAWMDQEMDRRRAEEEISKNAPCIRLIERPANRLHIVTILGARIGFGPGVDIQMEDERNLGEECEEEPPLLLSIDYSAAQGEETKQRPVEEMGYRLEVVGRPAADGQQFPAVELNGQEMEPNTKYSLRHEDLFRISNVEFAVHIHNGLNTCQGCEPGLFVSEPQNQPIKKKFSKHVERRRQMRALKAQYGLLGEDDDEKEDQQRGVELRQKYVDRARKRRMAVGSVGPVTAVQSVNAAGGIYRQCAAAPVAGCSADSVELKTAAAGKGNEFGGQKAIAESNKGFKLLQGMGWKSGQGLGKNSQGIQKPIETLVKNDRIGLGMESTSGRPKLVIQMSGGRQELLELTKRRYQQIESKAEQQEREEEKRKKK